jgi:hypothetical protein
MIERINRLGPLNFGYNQYIQEVSNKKISTEKIKVETEQAIDMPDYLGSKINFLI